MAEQLLWVNTLAALFAGVCLIVVPKAVTSLLGLPRVEQTFYARMLGVTLLGLAGATVAEGYGRQGLGIEGMAAINLVSGVALGLLLLFGGLVMAKRGRWVLRALVLFWILAGGLGLAAGGL